MKIEIKSASGPGYKASILEDGKMVDGVREVLISIKPERLPIVITHQTVFDRAGHPFLDETGEDAESRYVIYYPSEFLMGD